GSTFDARVLKDALDHGFNVPPGKFYLVDASYANTPQFIAPYRGTRYHLQEQGRVQQRP
uniref:DDE Tnp4 domain-containing protein n=1 Tax=Aegilops tauschii subsp. strangulata TaxID=200361 RepID=A0A453EFZ1_AEGTS